MIVVRPSAYLILDKTNLSQDKQKRLPDGSLKNIMVGSTVFFHVNISIVLTKPEDSKSHIGEGFYVNWDTYRFNSMSTGIS